MLDPLLLLVTYAEAESFFLLFELDADFLFSFDELFVFVLEEEALLFSLFAGVSRGLSSSELFSSELPSSESLPLFSSSSLQFGSTKSHLPLPVPAFNAVPLCKEIKLQFFWECCIFVV